MKFHESIIVITMLTILPSQSSNVFSKAKQNPNCKKIPPVKKLDMQWALELFVGKKFYAPMGSKQAYEDLGELLNGTRPKDSTDLDMMCPEITSKGFKSTIEGYNGRYLVVDCAIIRKGVQDCGANPHTEFPERHKAIKAIQTIAWTDNKSSIIVVRCSPDGEKNDWMLYSLNTTVSDEIKQNVRDQMTKHGFSASSHPIHYYNYSGCKLDTVNED